ncbi:SusC/RagA family TonB-linked outer membrane protein [Ferruginibacter sp. SUN106]|uniref:SusC/RagA family TonB-linked outer membrane protein n=1 Tax=Ferruginibacter sp. SUN106 TaxID=2978348 RepID=UPI003D366919
MKKKQAAALILKLMKLTFAQIVLTAIFAFSLYAKDVKGQDYLNKPVSITARQVEIKKIIAELESQANVKFVYSPKAIQASRKISCTISSKKLGEFLEEIFKSLDIGYKAADDQIILFKVSREKGLVVTTGLDNPSPGNLNVSDIIVSGTVRDDKGAPIVGVTVTEKGTGNRTVTNAKGDFRIVLKNEKPVLVFSSVGYETNEIAVNANNNTVDVVLKLANKGLDEVVVVGYGSQKKVNLSGAVAQVGGKDLVNRPVPNVTGALQGVLPGVTVLRGSGKPGAEGYGIRVRGFTSSNSANALVLVDGIEQDINLLDPNDVESITVLKDASASAIYGARAAAGVILVTTKQGAPGKTRVNFNTYYGINITARQPQRLDSWDEQTLIDEARFNATGAREFSAEQIEWLQNPNFSYRPNPTSDRWEYYGNNNWIKEGMDKINHQQNHSLSIGGGDQKVNYLVSGSFYQRDGILRFGPDDNKRYNFKLNLNAELNKYVSLKVTAGYIGSFTRENSYGTDQIINRLYRSRTRQSLYVPAEDVTGNKYNGDLQVNAVDIEKNAGLETRDYETFTSKLNFQVKNVIKGLTLDVIGWRNQNAYNMENNSKTLYWYGRSTNTVRFSINTPNTMSLVKNKAYQNNLQGFLTYNYKIKDHAFTLLQGGSYEEYRKDEVTATGQSMISNDFFSLNFADPLTKTSKDLVQTWALASAFGRLNYSFKGRYLLEASYRYDGSSRLAPSNRWQLFPSFSAAWRISEENFMKDLSFINNLKLRLSWGQLGNSAAIGLYDYIPLLTSGLTTNNNLVFNGTRTQYFYQSVLSSPDITWETVQQSNIGIDLGVLRNRLTITADYYVKRNKDMLATLNVPNIIGVATGFTNVGELKSWGSELDIKWRDKIRKFDYHVGFNISDNQNKLVHYDGKNSIGAGGVIALMEGYAINTVWGYKTDGFFQTDAEAAAYKTKVNYPFFANPKAGDMKYLDLNGDGVINSGDGTPQNPGDLVYLGTTNARYTYGFDLGLSWKGFDFSVFLQGAMQRKFLISEETLSPMLGTADMPWTIHMDRWTPDNPNAFFPRMYQTSAHNYKPSDRWAQNGNYLRLKNIQIGYTLPVKKKYAREIKLYVSGQDLWETTKVLSVFDPEVGNNVSATAYPFYRSVAFGLNISL